MSIFRKTLFISDLHLDESNQLIKKEFFKLLQNSDASIDALYILGDLFESWIGDDDDTLFHREIIQALKAATQKGLPIYLMYGNRDFLIGKRFLRKTGCKLLAEEEKINLYGTPVLLMHGDTLCTHDIEYLKARKRARNPLVQFVFRLLPLKTRKNFANKMRMKSARHTQTAAKEIMDVTQAEVERVLQKHAVKFLIHGHTHRPAIHQFPFNDSDATRIVLAAWHDRGSVLVWDEQGKKEMVGIG